MERVHVTADNWDGFSVSEFRMIRYFFFLFRMVYEFGQIYTPREAFTSGQGFCHGCIAAKKCPCSFIIG